MVSFSGKCVDLSHAVDVVYIFGLCMDLEPCLDGAANKELCILPVPVFTVH